MPYVLPHLDDFHQTFDAALSPEWYSIKAGQERFGSWEWHAWHWPDRRRPRAWVILAVTPTETVDHGATRAIIDAWAAAEMRQRYVRNRVSTVELELNDEASSKRRDVITMQIGMSAAQATQIRAADVIATYEPLEFVRPKPASSLSPFEELSERQAPSGQAGVLASEWLGPLRGRREISVGDAAALLGRSISNILELALQDVRDGRLRVQQRGREIYLLGVAGELTD